MAGGGMGAMPQGIGQQGGTGAPMGGNPMGGPGLGMTGAGMGGMGFGQGPGYGVDNFQAPQSVGGMPPGDTFVPQQSGYPQFNMNQLSGLLRGLQGNQGMPPQQQMQTSTQPQQMQQQMQQLQQQRMQQLQQQQMQQQPMQQLQQQQPMQQPRHGFFGATQAAPQTPTGIAGLQNPDRGQTINNLADQYKQFMAARRVR